MDNERENPERPAFSARLTPHRSLGPRGFVILMAVVSGISFTAGLVFWLAGAWPVFGFFGLDVLLVYWAFRANYRAARAWEQVEITGDSLVVERGHPGRETQRWMFHPYWVRVEIDEDENNAARHDGREDWPQCGPLMLRSHGSSLEIGAFLAPFERRELAAALRGALAAHRG